VVLSRLRECGRLVTLQVECGPWEERIEQRTVIRFWPDAVETVSALVRGCLSYGIDLCELKKRDVTISDDGRTITIRMPPVRVLDARLLVEPSRILCHDGPRLWPKDSSLREAVLAQAERRLQKLRSPVAQRQAREQAERVISDLVCRALRCEVEVRFVYPDDELLERGAAHAN
jgi:hypothetical protein